MIKGTLDTGSASIPEHVACLLAVKHAVLEAWDGFPFNPPSAKKNSAKKKCWEVLHTRSHTHSPLGALWDAEMVPLWTPPTTR